MKASDDSSDEAPENKNKKEAEADEPSTRKKIRNVRNKLNLVIFITDIK